MKYLKEKRFIKFTASVMVAPHIINDKENGFLTNGKIVDIEKLSHQQWEGLYKKCDACGKIK